MSRSKSRAALQPEPPHRPSLLPVAIPKGGRFEGLLSFRGAARIDGQLRGQAIVQGTLVLGESATVEARIETDELIVAGTLEGHVRATRRIQLLSSARVTGELCAPRVRLVDGCQLRGRCRAGPRADGVAESPASLPSLP